MCRNALALFDMSYFGKFYLVGPEATKAANWLFTADVSKAPGTSSVPLASATRCLCTALGNHILHRNKLGGRPKMAFLLNAAFAEGMGSVGERLLSLSSPEAGFCSHLHRGKCALSWGGDGGGGLALWLQLWLTAGDVMDTGGNQARPSPAVVCTGRSWHLLWGWEAASAPRAELEGKKHWSCPPSGAGTSRVRQGIPRQ